MEFVNSRYLLVIEFHYSKMSNQMKQYAKQFFKIY